jgi:glycine dehydrogenase subunit 1
VTYVPHTQEERRSMLEDMGASSVEELIQCIPPRIRLTRDLHLPTGLSEMEVSSAFTHIAEKNRDVDHHLCFLGGGFYDHSIPSVIDHILRRSEFYTAYTPYQPEVSQGTLQATYEYQSMICHITGMEVANASMYDGASAAAEAILLAHSVTKRTEVVLSQTLNPFYREVIETYCRNMGLSLRNVQWNEGITDVGELRAALSKNSACCLIQHPNFFGCLEPMPEIESIVHESGALFIAAVDPISLGLVNPPGTYGADIALGDGQALGNDLSYGGPSFGFFATRKKFIRRIPGRIVGLTQDSQGRRGFVLTLQTREQHIRREKATSNICTNEALNALAGAVYLCLCGRDGLTEIADLCVQKSHYAVERIEGLQGYQRRFPAPFFKEFVIKTPQPPTDIVHRLAEHGLFAGISLDRFEMGLNDCLLLAVTEKRTKADIDVLVQHLARF